MYSKEAESILLKSGFEFIRSKGSHRIYKKSGEIIVIPYHSNKSLHPKIVKSIIDITTKEN